jgi:hypothetical protein
MEKIAVEEEHIAGNHLDVDKRETLEDSSDAFSLYHSSRVPIGLRILPTLTGLMSRRLGFCTCSFSRRALRTIRSNSANV